MMYDIAFIGCGNFGKAIIENLLIDSKHINKVTIYDRNLFKLENIKKDLSNPKIFITDRFAKCVENTHIIFLAIKPKDSIDLLKKLEQIEYSQKNVLLISCMASINISTINKATQNKFITARLMTNLAIAKAKIPLAIYIDDQNKSSQKILVDLFAQNSKLYFTSNEEELHMITVILGSAPALFLQLSHNIANANKNIDYKQAKKLSQAALKSAAILLSDKKDPRQINDKIASAQGITGAALEDLHNNNFNNIVSSAIDSAYKRSLQICIDYDFESNKDIK